MSAQVDASAAKVAAAKAAEDLARAPAVCPTCRNDDFTSYNSGEGRMEVYKCDQGRGPRGRRRGRRRRRWASPAGRSRRGTRARRARSGAAPRSLACGGSRTRGRARGARPGRDKGETFPNFLKPRISVGFHSIWLIFERAITSRGELKAWMPFSRALLRKHPR